MSDLNVVVEVSEFDVEVEQGTVDVTIEESVVAAVWVGPQGIQGPKGDQGFTGPAGAQGPPGTTGATGAKGDKGDKGDPGDEGPRGLTGLTGATGPSGSTGAAGPTGPQGKSAYQIATEAGFPGDITSWLASLKGETGDTGPVGPTGPEGPAGPTGPAGPEGTIPSTLSGVDIPLDDNTITGTLDELSSNIAGGVAGGMRVGLAEIPGSREHVNVVSFSSSGPGATIMPTSANNLAHCMRRGATFTATLNGSPVAIGSSSTVANVSHFERPFNAGGQPLNFRFLNPTDVIVMEVDTTLMVGNAFTFSGAVTVGFEGRAAVTPKTWSIDVFYCPLGVDANGYWVNIASYTNLTRTGGSVPWGAGICLGHWTQTNDTDKLTKFRFTCTDFPDNQLQVASMFACMGSNRTTSVDYSISRVGGTLFGTAASPPTFTVVSAAAEPNVHVNVVPKGTGRFQVAGVNVPTVSSVDTITNKTISGASNTITNIPHSALPAPHPMLRTDLTTGLLSIPRLTVYEVGSWAFYSGLLSLVYLYPTQNRTVSSLSVFLRDAGGVATTAQLGLYSVNGSGDLTLQASTTNDTNFLTSSWSTVTKSLSSSVSLVAGNVYAVGYLIVSSNSMGAFEGTNGRWSVSGYAPRLTAKLESQTSLPSSVSAGSLLDVSHALLVVAS